MMDQMTPVEGAEDPNWADPADMHENPAEDDGPKAAKLEHVAERLELLEGLVKKLSRTEGTAR